MKALEMFFDIELNWAKANAESEPEHWVDMCVDLIGGLESGRIDIMESSLLEPREFHVRRSLACRGAVKRKSDKKYAKIRSAFIRMEFETTSHTCAEILGVFFFHLKDCLEDEARGYRVKFANSGDQRIVTIWDECEFTLCKLKFKNGINKKEVIVDIDDLCIGVIDEDVLSKFAKGLWVDDARKLIDTFSGKFQRKIDSADFLFLRALMDYQNISTSEALGGAFRHARAQFPFLFEPGSKTWVELHNADPKDMHRILRPILMSSMRGMIRRDKDQTVKSWIATIEFLNRIDGASNFFCKTAEELGLDTKNHDSLEMFHRLMSSKRIRNAAKISLDYGEKAGRVLLMVLTENNRGHGYLKGISREHVENLSIPVDTQILRLALNTGLVRVTHIPERHLKVPKKKGEKKKTQDDGTDNSANEMDELGDTQKGEMKTSLPRMLSLRRVNFTEICQKAWKRVAQEIEMLPIDLDEYLFEVGSLLCKDRGRMCYLCPFTEICRSYQRGRVFEAAGKKVRNGCFTYSQTGDIENAFHIRCCESCEDGVNHRIGGVSGRQADLMIAPPCEAGDSVRSRNQSLNDLLSRIQNLSR